MADGDRLLELDVLRGVAAFEVLCFHYAGHLTRIYSPTDYSQVPAFFQFFDGRFYVELFFMISGFVIFMTLEKTGHPLDFIVSRFSRLYPGYWVAVILTFLVVKASHLPNRETSLTEAWINMSMLQDWVGAKSVDSVYWTLTVELSFYALMILIFISKGSKHIEWLGMAWLALMAWNAGLLGPAPFHVPAWLETSKLLKEGHLFIAGILFYNLKAKGSTWFRHLLLALCLFVQYVLSPHLAGSIVVTAFFGLFYLFIAGKLSWIVHKPLVFLGAISYSLYLTHQYIGYAIIRYLYTIHSEIHLRFILPTFCSLLIASAITFAVERPAMAYIRQKYKDWKGKSRAGLYSL